MLVRWLTKPAAWVQFSQLVIWIFSGRSPSHKPMANQQTVRLPRKTSISSCLELELHCRSHVSESRTPREYAKKSYTLSIVLVIIALWPLYPKISCCLSWTTKTTNFQKYIFIFRVAGRNYPTGTDLSGTWSQLWPLQLQGSSGS